ncbi:NUDIX hydrolase [Micromonospora robiginosa]|uniref:NUDIX domain-containing protein n=1 Tax=Micromonospora robiginosa TaxID=2749844 RepID=A0A7L6B224_9ACTN|nr:NUDIX domain-containing protein [Micromonospora ferruginea]QLQ36022.1 NUDIX domain-containing protein [Micromonospora ferruginea]
MGPYRRHSARVLLVDRAGRLLLLRFRFAPTGPARGHGWVTPGGGVEGDEPLAHAAAREVREEIGLVVDPDRLGRPVAYRVGADDRGPTSGLFRDDFFLHRLDRHDVDVGGMESHERVTHAGHRWWTLDELASTRDVVYPLGLSTLLADVLDGRVPTPARRLP